MGDRRPSLFSRLWLSILASRRTTAHRRTQQSPADTTTPTSDETSSDSTTATPATPSTAGNANARSSTTPPASETISAGQTTTSTPTPTTLPIAETQKAEKETNLTTNAIPTTPATTETQTAGQATTPSSTTPLTDETQSQTPSQSNRSTTLAATMPPSSEAQMDNQTTVTSIVPTQPASPFRATTKSPSPPQPSSPSRVAPQSPVMPSSRSPQGSVTPLTPQRTSKLQSPSRSASRSPNQISSPSTKGVQHTTEEIPHPLSNSHEAPNTVSNGEAPKPATSEQEPLEIQSKTEVKSETVDDSHNQTAFETSIKQNEMEVEPSKSNSDETSSDSTTATPATPSTAGNANARSSTTPPASETISAGQTTTSTPTPTTLPIAETQKAEKETNLTTNAILTTPATTETQTAGQATTPSSTTPLTDETQSQTPSQSNRSTTLAATMPPSSEAQMDNQTTVTSIVPTQPASPFRATTKSPSPPQPSSPSRVAPQSPVMPSSRSPHGSVTPLTPQRTSKLQSPSRSASRSPNQISSPSTKGVQHTTEEIPHPLSNSHEAPNTVSNGEAPKPATSEQEPLEIQSKTEVKSETVDDSHNQTAFETSIKQNEMEVEPSKSNSDETSSDSTTATPATPSTAGNANARSSTTPPASETISAGQTTTSTPTPTTLPIAETQKAEKETNLTTNAILTTPATTETQTAGQATTPSSTTPLTDETQSQTPSQSNRSTTLAATMPPSSEAQMDNQTTVTSIVPTQPASPFRATTKSPSPPQPSSPSRVAPQSPVMPSSRSPQGSVTPLTPQRTSKLQSPSRSASRSPNQISSPSTKGVQHTTEEIPHPLSNSHEAPNTVSNGEAPKPATSEQEPLEIQSKTEVKSETADDSHNQTAFETSIKQNEMEVEPSKSSELEAAAISTVAQGPETADATQKLDSSSIDAKTKSLLESNANPEETKEVKEVIEETKCEANEKRNDEGNDFKTAKSGSIAQPVEEGSIINKSEQMQEGTLGAIGKKEILKTSPFNGKPTKTSSRPGNKSMSAPTHKFTQSSREPVPLHKEIKDDILTFFNRMAIRDPQNPLNDKPGSVITLAGENRGALMHLGSDSSKGEGAIHIHRGYKINPDESPEATIDGEGSWKGKTSEDAEGKEDQPTEAYLNNNTQGINNSIVFKSSIAERNPGVHMIVTHAQKEPTKSTDEKMPLEVQKAEFNAIPTQKLTYESNVRRRCLQRLLLESSDSDPENPERPKRHGCRVGREERRKYNTRDVL